MVLHTFLFVRIRWGSWRPDTAEFLKVGCVLETRSNNEDKVRMKYLWHLFSRSPDSTTVAGFCNLKISVQNSNVWVYTLPLAVILSVSRLY